MNILKRTIFDEKEKKIMELKNELKSCDMLIKSCQSLYELTTDDCLIEARIYQLMSLAKHREYIVNSIRKLSSQEQAATGN